MRTTKLNKAVLFGIVVCLLWCRSSLSLHAVRADEISFKLIDGKPCSRCTISCGEKSISANLVVNLGLHVPLLLHSKTAKQLDLKPSDRISVVIPGVAEGTFKDLAVRTADVSMLAELTREYAAELDEIPAVAVLGLPAFGKLIPQLDIPEGAIRLLDKVDSDAKEAEVAAKTDSGSVDDKTSAKPRRSWIWNFSEKNTGYFLDGLGPDGMKMPVRFHTAQFDTTIDQEVAALAGAAGGELDTFTIGAVDLMKFVALRPVDLARLPKPRPDLITGTNLFSCFRVTVDRPNLRIILMQTRDAVSPAAERAYFTAVADLDSDSVESFIESNPNSRLAREASAQLLQMRLEEYPPDDEAMDRAIEFRGRFERNHRRASTLVTLAQELLGGNREDRLRLARMALDHAAKNPSADLDANVAHRIQAGLGRIAFLDGKLKQSRRHLLSAAFGLPRDPLVNLWMGELYEKMGKKARAWSRFMQSATDRNPPPQAFEGLDRLHHDPQFRAEFSMAEAEQLLEGRMPEFHPATRRADEATGKTGSASKNPVPLVELFTCIDHAPTQTAELALAALGEYFDGQPPVLIEYHLAEPAPDPLAVPIGKSRAAYYGVELPAVAVFGGTKIISGSQRSCPDAGGPAKVFETYKAACFEVKDIGNESAKSGCKLQGRIELEKTVINGSVQVAAAESDTDYRLHIILCESPLMVPGANGLVIRRYVARRALSPPEGHPLRFSGDKLSHTMPIKIDLAEVGKLIDKEIAAMEEEGEITFHIRPDYIDPVAVSVAVFVQDEKTKRIVAAASLEPRVQVEQQNREVDPAAKEDPR